MFNPRTNWPTSPSKLSSRLKQLRREGAYVLDLTESNPTRCDFVYDVDAIRAALAGHQVIEYDPQPKGMRTAREAVAAYYEERGTPIPTDRILLTSGSSEAYAHCFRMLCEPGDEILAPQPSYPLFEFLADITGVELKHYPLFYDNGWSIDFDALKAAITPRTKAILVVTPNNPTGQILQPQERDKLSRLAMMRELAIISDEVFLDFLWDEDARASTFDPRSQALTLTISGISKISALPQMKLGWVTVRGPVGVDADAVARLEVMTDTFLSVSTPTQVAARTLLEARKRMQPQVLDRIRENLDFLDAKLSGRTPLTRLKADGGWYAVLRGPASMPDEERALDLLDRAGVHVHPGELFGFDRPGHWSSA
ncbi:MAG: pyridoxal phosphate-dependent aminotransferase [Bryobacterales bacterium]